MKFRSNKEVIYKNVKYNSNEFRACNKEDPEKDDIIFDKNKKRD